MAVEDKVIDATKAGVVGKIETNRWYDIRIEVQGPSVKAYLDGKLVQQARR